MTMTVTRTPLMCNDTLCMHRGMCELRGANYVCHCLQEYTGQHCEKKVGTFYTNGTVGFITSNQAIYSYHHFTNESVNEMSEANSYCISFGTDGLAMAQPAEELEIIKDGYTKFVGFIDVKQYHMAGHTDVPNHNEISMPDVNISHSGKYCVVMSNWQGQIALYSKECHSRRVVVGAVCTSKL